MIAAVVAYHNAISTPFFFDDRPAVERNESIRQLWPPWTALNPPESAAGAAGRPVINLSFAVNYALGGLALGPATKSGKLYAALASSWLLLA